jgi:hypothetical protein
MTHFLSLDRGFRAENRANCKPRKAVASVAINNNHGSVKMSVHFKM